MSTIISLESRGALGTLAISSEGDRADSLDVPSTKLDLDSRTSDQKPIIRTRVRTSLTDETASVIARYEQKIQQLQDMLASIQASILCVENNSAAKNLERQAIIATQDAALKSQRDTIDTLTQRVSQLSCELEALGRSTKRIIDYQTPPPVTHRVHHIEQIYPSMGN